MTITERISPAVDNVDGDQEWTPEQLLLGVLEVPTNTSPTTVKTFPHNTAFIVTDRIRAGDTTEVIVWNRGAADFEIAANSGGTTLLAGDTIVPAGGIRRVKIAVTYTSGVLALFST